MGNGIENVLLVDDEEIVIGVGKQMLERLGYTVVTATNGQEAVDFHTNNPGGIDLVLVPGFVSHVEWYWESPKAERMLRRVSSFSRVIMFGQRSRRIVASTPSGTLAPEAVVTGRR